MKRQTKSSVDYKKFSKDSGSDDEETELFIRNKPKRPDIPTIDKIIEDGDTLQSLAIRYQCTIEDLKRVNNIHKENEIFAKRTIKVPHRPFTMALAGVHSGTTSPDHSPSTSTNVISSSALQTKLSDTLINLNDEQKIKEVNDIIFNSSIIQKPQINNNNIDLDHEISEDLLNEEIRLLPQINNVHSNVTDPVINKMNWSGADCGISWIALIVLSCIGIVVLPLIYLFYIAEHPEKYHQGSS